MGKNSALRRKIAKKKAAAAAINLDNAKPHQMAAVLAERERLIDSALKRLSPAQRALLAKSREAGSK